MIQKVDEILKSYIDELDCLHASEMFALIESGKKLRSKLILKIANQSEEIFKFCAIVELIHLASLLHDDVIDSSNLRRGKPSINSIFGDKNAIMLGDILYSKGFFELTKFDKKIASIISDAVCKLSIGELLDVKFSENFNDNLEKYLKMIYYKTAILIEASARSAALLSNQNEENFANYGKNLGLAFQIVDDILDITQSEKTLGKPAFSDYKEGKTTLPYIILHSFLNQNDKLKLKSLFKKELNDDEISWIKSKFEEFGVVDLSIKKAREYGNLALENIEDDGLKDIVKSMIYREF